MTGFTVFIEAHRLIPLPITVEEALRTTVSAGVLVPTGEMIEKLETNLGSASPATPSEPATDPQESA
jgi:uncharacterized membrane protein